MIEVMEVADSDEHGSDGVLAHLRHELRTPLNAVIGYSEMLLEDAEDAGLDTLRPDLEKIHQSGEELLALIQEHVRPDSSHVTDTLWSDLRNATRDPLRKLLDSTEALSSAITQEAPEMAPDVEKIDAAGHKLKARVENLADHPPALGRGSAGDSQPSPDSGRKRTALRKMPTVGHGNVLVVDDNAVNRDVLAQRLDRLGYQVVLAESGREALETMDQGDFDLLLLDVLMPDMNGYEVLRKIKEDGAHSHVPVIMISALDEIEGVARCIEMGAEDYLAKPFDPVLLRARTGSSIEKKRLRDKELLYLSHVARLTEAASALEEGRFDSSNLAEVGQRNDELGHLGRVFSKMAEEVRRREERLQRRVAELKIEIDETRKEKQVDEITDSEYFRKLQKRASALRQRLHKALE